MTSSIIGSFLKIAVLKIGELCLQRTCNFINTETVVQQCSVKKVFLEILKNPQDLELQLYLKKRLLHRCFAVNFAKYLRTTFLTEHLWWLLLLIFNFFYVSRILLTFSKTFFQNFQSITSFSETDTEYT